MNWEKALILIGQLGVLAALATLVALGHNSGIQDALMAVCGSIAGIGAYQALRKSNSPSQPPL